jgi:polyhydroxyalkanoate synthesis regulator phasin
MDLRTIIRNSVYFGVGAVSMTREKVEELIGDLVRRGELSSGEGKRFSDELTRSIEKARKDLDARIRSGTRKAAEALDLVTRDDIRRLDRRIDRLGADLRKWTPETDGKKKDR